MKRPNRPGRWQFDLFIVLMIILMILLLQARLSSSWETAGEIGWSALTLVGMGLWLRDNHAALDHEEQQRRRGRRAPDQPGTPESRTIPSTPIQRRFLAAAQEHTKDAE